MAWPLIMFVQREQPFEKRARRLAINIEHRQMLKGTCYIINLPKLMNKQDDWLPPNLTESSPPCACMGW